MKDVDDGNDGDRLKPGEPVMRCLAVACGLALFSGQAFAHTDRSIPLGRLNNEAVPTAYRLDLTVLPDQPRFTGHVEIDVFLRSDTSRIYLHGRGLHVTRAAADRVGSSSVAATWTEVDPTGVARLDFPRPLPAGKLTLAFDYDTPFRESPTGLYHVKVGDEWYAWNHFESIDARAAFPSFDQPGFKAPFSVTIATKPGFQVVTNTPEVGMTKSGGARRASLRADQTPSYISACGQRRSFPPSDNLGAA